MQLVFIPLAIALTREAMAQETRVIINLSEQRVYLVERGKVILIAPIASGKPGRSTPTGKFAIISKDIDHRSRSFGSVVDGFGRIAILNWERKQPDAIASKLQDQQAAKWTFSRRHRPARSMLTFCQRGFACALCLV